MADKHVTGAAPLAEDSSKSVARVGSETGGEMDVTAGSDGETETETEREGQTEGEGVRAEREGGTGTHAVKSEEEAG